MQWLALLAVLLVALAPALSRAAASNGTQVLDGWTELCTTAGLAWVDTSVVLSKDASPAKAPSGDTAMGADCAYCPLAASLTLALLFIALVFPHACQRDNDTWPSPLLRARANLRGLGGQGPPILL